jgi:hypothetical protein
VIRTEQANQLIFKGHPMTRTTFHMIALTLVGAAALAACGGRNDTAVRDTAAAVKGEPGSLEGATRADSAGGMAGMPGMGGMMAGMMDSMQTHMRMMDTVSADHMKAMLPMHRQMVANMLSRMSQDMRSMNMPADHTWTATADSVRQDLTRMPKLSARELEAMMVPHRARMTRLMQMHRDMMGRMKS